MFALLFFFLSFSLIGFFPALRPSITALLYVQELALVGNWRATTARNTADPLPDKGSLLRFIIAFCYRATGYEKYFPFGTFFTFTDTHRYVFGKHVVVTINNKWIKQACYYCCFALKRSYRLWDMNADIRRTSTKLKTGFNLENWSKIRMKQAMKYNFNPYSPVYWANDIQSGW